MGHEIDRRGFMKSSLLAAAGVAMGPAAARVVAAAAPTAPMAGKRGLDALRGQTVTCLVSDHPVVTTIQSLIPEFEEKTGIKVILDKVAHRALPEKVLLTRGSKDYDVVMLQGDDLPNFVDKGLCYPLDDLVASDLRDPEFSLDSLVPCWLDNCKFQGKLWSLPSSMEIGVLYYRKDLFKKHLGGKTPPKTYAEYLEDAKRINLKEKDVYAHSWRGVDAQNWQYLIPAWGERWVDANWTPQVQTPGHLEICNYMLDSAKYCPPGWVAWYYQEVWMAFQQGNIAMLIDASVAPTMVNPKVSKLTWQEVGVTAPPRGPKSFAKYNGASGQTFGLAAGVQHKEAAYKWIEFQVLPRNDKKLVARGRVPHVLANYKDPELLKDYPALDGVREAIEAGMRVEGPDRSFRPRSKALKEMRTVMSRIYSTWASGKQAPQAALAELQREFERITQEAGLRKG